MWTRSNVLASGMYQTRAKAFAARNPVRQTPAFRSASRAAIGRVRATTQEDAITRRMRESEEVQNRVIHIQDKEELAHHLANSGQQLVVLEIQGESVCETGLEEEAELQWKLDAKKEEARRLEACEKIRNRFSRTARECEDVKFLEIQISEGSTGEALMGDLGVQVLPTIQFYRDGYLLWTQQGSEGMESQLGEGILYYGDSAGGGLKATDFVKELRSCEALEEFIELGAQDDQLTVINVSTSMCAPCIKIYPAVLALAKNFVGYARFARFLGDETEETEAKMGELNIIEVPTFIFMRNGKEIERHVGSSRGDIIGKILTLQDAAGLGAPPPPPNSGRAKVGSRGRRASS